MDIYIYYELINTVGVLHTCIRERFGVIYDINSYQILHIVHVI